jgi:hypothetical protein
MLGGLSAKFDIKRDVVALSLARLGDAVGNSLLFVVIALYVTRMPAPGFPLYETAGRHPDLGIRLFSAFAEPLSGSLMVQSGQAVMAGTLLAYVRPAHSLPLHSGKGAPRPAGRGSTACVGPPLRAAMTR